MAGSFAVPANCRLIRRRKPITERNVTERPWLRWQDGSSGRAVVANERSARSMRTDGPEAPRRLVRRGRRPGQGDGRKFVAPAGSWPLPSRQTAGPQGRQTSTAGARPPSPLAPAVTFRAHRHPDGRDAVNCRSAAAAHDDDRDWRDVRTAPLRSNSTGAPGCTASVPVIRSIATRGHGKGATQQARRPEQSPSSYAPSSPGCSGGSRSRLPSLERAKGNGRYIRFSR